MVYDDEGSGRPTFCPEPVAWQGRFRLAGANGKWMKVWSCELHVEGVEQVKRLPH